MRQTIGLMACFIVLHNSNSFVSQAPVIPAAASSMRNGGRVSQYFVHTLFVSSQLLVVCH